jgi:protein-S-isoprenylcysteine O-methyltransferase Ste14
VGRIHPPPVLFFTCLILATLAQHFWPLSIADYSFRSGMTVGAFTLLLAATLAAWGIFEMKLRRTPIEPGQIPAHLVTTGPFRFTRNPLYLALLLVFTALAVMGNSLWLLLGTGALLLLLDRLVVVREEAAIKHAFGSEYSAYVARVRRWL